MIYRPNNLKKPHPTALHCRARLSHCSQILGESCGNALICNIADLRDHLRQWALKNSNFKGKVDAAFAGSLELPLRCKVREKNS